MSLLKRTIKGLKSIIGPGHSPAGKRHLKRLKKKQAEMRGFSGRTKKQLGYLSDADREAVLKAMRKR